MIVVKAKIANDTAMITPPNPGSAASKAAEAAAKKKKKKKKDDDDDDGRGTFTYHQLTILAQHAYALSLGATGLKDEEEEKESSVHVQ